MSPPATKRKKTRKLHFEQAEERKQVNPKKASGKSAPVKMPATQRSEEFVDIHGNEISVLVNDNGSILIPLEELKSRGFSIYKKSQFHRLLIPDSKFDDAFNSFMLDAAKNYMLDNKITFQAEDVLKSIENCKKLLSDPKKASTSLSTSPQVLLQNRSVEENADCDFKIKAIVSSEQTKKQNNSGKYSIKALQDFSKKRNDDRLSVSSSVSSESDFTGKSNGFQTNNSALKPLNNFQNGHKPKATPVEDSFKRLSIKPSPEQNKTRNENKIASPSASIAGNSKDNSFDLKSNNKNGKFTPNSYENKYLATCSSIELKDVERVKVIQLVQDKPLIWVQRLKDKETMEKIDAEIAKNVEKLPEVHTNTYDTEQLYLVKFQDKWHRGKIVNFKPVAAFLVDHGKTVRFDSIKEVSTAIREFPCLAHRLAFRSDAAPGIGDEVEITIGSRYKDGTYTADIKKVLAKDSLTKATVEKSDVIKKEAPVPKSVLVDKLNALTTPNLNRPEKAVGPSAPQLQDGEKVAIVYQRNLMLFLRTRSGFANLKTINEMIKNVQLKPLERDPKVGDLVLCQQSNERNEFIYCRGIVKSLDSNYAEVNYLDYPTSCFCSFDSLMQSTRELNGFDISYLTLKHLAGYKKSDYTEVMGKFIKDKIEKRYKYTIVKVGDAFDLFDDKAQTTLSKMLLELEMQKEEKVVENGAASDVFKLADIQVYKPKFEKDSYMCTYFKSLDNLVFIHVETLEDNIDKLIYQTIDDEEPHSPVVGEVCIAFYKDSWYRGAVVRVIDDSFEIFFIDFGNVEIKKAKEIRKATPELLKTEAMALACRFDDVPDVPNVEEVMKEHILENSIYNVNFIKFSNGKYNISIPAVHEKLKSC